MISVGGVPVIGGRTVAAADISDASATGRNVLTGGAAAGRTALGAAASATTVAGAPLSGDVSTATIATALAAARATTPSLASSSGWTGSSYGGGTTGAVNTGASKLDFAVNANGSGSVIERTIPLARDWSLQCRVVAMSDTTTNVRLLMLPYSGSGVSYPQIAVDGSGGFECKYIPATGVGDVATPRTLTAALTGVRAAMTAGTLWLRLQCTGGFISYWYGIGSGTAEPTAWLLLTTYAPPGKGNGEATPTTFNAQLARTASSGAQTASVDLISYRDLTL